MRAANLVLKFLLELAALAAYAATALVLLGLPIGIVAAVVAVTIVVVVWGRWAAPRARRRLAAAGRIPLELVILLGGAVALVFVAPVLAIVDAALIVLNAVLLTLWRQWEG